MSHMQHTMRAQRASLAVVLLLLAAAVMPARAAAPTLPAGTLDAAALSALFTDRTVHSRTVNKGRESQTYYAPDGGVSQKRQGTLRFGRWRVSKNGRICLQMETRREKCRIIVREADGHYRKYIVRKDGNHQPTVDYLTFAEGNRLGF